ncbi:hypothetical protein BH20GEM2_BH20GEM2_18530 [soil metagenome]
MVIESDRENRRESTEEKVGEGVGGVGGALGGAALGSAVGPIGTILGAIAGGAGGWWAGEKAGRAAEGDHYTEEHDRAYRSHWESDKRPDRVGDYDRARVGYGVGHYAGKNPQWKGRKFEDIEPEIKRNWKYQDADYDTMRPYVREGYMTGGGTMAGDTTTFTTK